MTEQLSLGPETPGMRLLRLLRREFGAFVSMTQTVSVPARTLARFDAVGAAFIAETDADWEHDRLPDLRPYRALDDDPEFLAGDTITAELQCWRCGKAHHLGGRLQLGTIADVRQRAAGECEECGAAMHAYLAVDLEP